ncbi:MAG: FKBP-type peptidyl-prolyl cis-trans isomerase [Hydrogenophilus sp.]|nr:FKBP-type peptidyl-prolyl cis-trans isomerase [Hydrogenophilus sp.]
MTLSEPPTVSPHAIVTLRYRLTIEGGPTILDTFITPPATLQIGDGTLAPFLERHLIGLPLGAKRTFRLPPEIAFGPRDPQRILSLPRTLLPPDARPGDIVTVAFPPGPCSGLIAEQNSETTVVDFNHPLAGKTLLLEVEIIGIC